MLPSGEDCGIFLKCSLASSGEIDCGFPCLCVELTYCDPYRTCAEQIDYS